MFQTIKPVNVIVMTRLNVMMKYIKVTWPIASNFQLHVFHHISLKYFDNLCVVINFTLV